MIKRFRRRIRGGVTLVEDFAVEEIPDTVALELLLAAPYAGSGGDWELDPDSMIQIVCQMPIWRMEQIYLVTAVKRLALFLFASCLRYS